MTINTKANVGDTIYAVYNDGFLKLQGPLTVAAVEVASTANKDGQHTTITYHTTNSRVAFKCEESVVYTTLDTAVARYTELANKLLQPS